MQQHVVIASEAEDKSKNKLDTGTISFEDIENKADFNVDHTSINMGIGSDLSPTAGAPSTYHNEGSDSSTTKSAVEEGTLIVRDTDKQKEQDRMDALDLVKDITAQAHDVVNKYDLINAEEKYKGLSDSERDELKKKVEQELKDKGLPATDDAIDNYIINQFVQNDGIGNMGGSFSKGLDAASSIISGIITGDITGGLAGASAPYLAEQIKKATTNADGTVNTAANLIAHAILGAAVAAVQGNSALAGAGGAAGGEVIADIIRKELYGDKDVKDLTEAEKQNISNLAQLATGLAAAAISGGSVSDVGTAVAGSKNAVENNYLTAQDIIDFVEKLENVKTEDEKKELIEKLKELDQRQQKKAENTAISQKKQLEQLNQLKELLVSDKCNETCKELISYSISELEPVATNSARHGYNITKYAWVEAILLLVTDDPLSSMALGSIVKNSNKAKIPVSGASVAADVSKIDEMIAKVESSAGKGTTGQVSNKLIPDNLASQFAEHNSQIGVLNRKQGTISGAHKQDAFLESVEMSGAKVNLTITDKSYPGLVEYKYQIPAVNNKGQQIGFKAEQTKTTYDPKILSDSKVTDMSNKAAQQAESYFKVNPDNRQYSVKVDGYWFQVTRDAKTGQINNAFITMPPRGSK